MIAKRFKLPIREFSRQNRKRRASFSCFSLKTRENSLGFNRIGVVVPAKAVKKAAERNKWRRFLYDIAGRFPQKNLDILVYFSPKNKCTKDDVRADMEKAGSMLP